MMASTFSHDVIALLRRNRRLLGGASLYLGERLIASVLSLVVFVLLARLYSPAEYGMWAFTLGIMQFAAAFLVSAAEPIVVRQLLQSNSSRHAVMGSAALVIGVTSVLALVLPLGFILIWYRDNPVVMTIGLLYALACVPNFLLVLEYHLRAQERALELSRARFVAVVLGAALKIILALQGVPIQWLAAILPIEICVQVAILWMSVRNEKPKQPRWRVDMKLARSLLWACLPAMLAAVLVTLFFRINYLLLERLSNFEQVGFYALAFSVLQIVLMVPSVAMSALYPRLCDLFTRDVKRFSSVFHWLYFGAAAFGYACTLLVFLFGKPIVEWGFGSKYLESVPTLIVMFLALSVLATGVVRASVINILQVQRLHVWSAAIGLVLLIPISIAAIRIWGATGAAIGILISGAASCTFSSFLFPQLRSHARSQVLALLLLSPFFSPLTPSVLKTATAGPPEGPPAA